MNHAPLQPGLLPCFVLLAASKLLERFGFYAIHTILMMYLISEEGGLGMGALGVLPLMATFTFLIIALQFVGAILADFFLGTSKTVFWGGVLALVGYVTMALGANIYVSIILICLGSGCYTPSHWGCLGSCSKLISLA
jgi:POT family proton-dependent oligopeptide transporter